MQTMSILLPGSRDTLKLGPRARRRKQWSSWTRKISAHAVVKDLFTHSFSDHHDVKLKTRSLHGHKHFTAWEWSMTFKFAKGPDGKRLHKDEARPQKLIGCTLMWWNDQDKIIRNHEYMQVRESQEEADVTSGPNQFLSGQSPSGVGTPKL